MHHRARALVRGVQLQLASEPRDTPWRASYQRPSERTSRANCRPVWSAAAACVVLKCTLSSTCSLCTHCRVSLFMLESTLIHPALYPWHMEQVNSRHALLHSSQMIHGLMCGLHCRLYLPRQSKQVAMCQFHHGSQCSRAHTAQDCSLATHSSNLYAIWRYARR